MVLTSHSALEIKEKGEKEREKKEAEDAMMPKTKEEEQRKLKKSIKERKGENKNIKIVGGGETNGAKIYTQISVLV